MAALEDKVKALEQKTAAMSVETIDDRPSVVFNGVNLHVRDGTGSTKCNDDGCDGVGNLIIGYNESDPHSVRTGSHNLIVGSHNQFSSYGGMVVGYRNRILGEYASVSGGYLNDAKGRYASISGGDDNYGARHRGEHMRW